MCADVTGMRLVLHNPTSVKWTNAITFVCVCVCVCVYVCVCGHVYVVYEDTNLYNDMGMT